MAQAYYYWVLKKTHKYQGQATKGYSGISFSNLDNHTNSKIFGDNILIRWSKLIIYLHPTS